MDEPNPVIVNQAGRTLRSITEGAIGSLLANAATPARCVGVYQPKFPIWTSCFTDYPEFAFWRSDAREYTPRCLQASPLGPFSLSEPLGTTLCRPLQGPNGCTRGLLHQFFRHRSIAGPFASIFYHRRVCVTPWEPVAARSCLAWPRTGAASDASRPAAEGIAGVLDQTSAGLYLPYAVSWSRTSRRSSSAARVLSANCRILDSNRSCAL
jgi:hypothetical protein